MNVRHKWVMQLAALSYPADPGFAAQAMRPYLAAPGLADMPDAAFTAGSLEAALIAPRKMAIPSYDEVLKPLRAWWRDNRPYVPALPAPRIPDRVPPTDAEIAAVAATMREILAALSGSPSATPHSCGTRAVKLSDADRAALWHRQVEARYATLSAQVARLREAAASRQGVSASD